MNEVNACREFKSVFDVLSREYFPGGEYQFWSDTTQFLEKYQFLVCFKSQINRLLVGQYFSDLFN